MTATATPTPMPAWAPVERPEEEEMAGMVDVAAGAGAGAGAGARPGLLERVVWVGLADVERVVWVGLEDVERVVWVELMDVERVVKRPLALPSSAVVIGAGAGTLAIEMSVVDCGALRVTVKEEGLPLMSIASTWSRSPNFVVGEVPKVRSTE